VSAEAPTLTSEQLLWRRRVFAATWLSYVGYYLCRKPFSIVKGRLGDAMQWDAVDLGWIGAVNLLAYTIGQFAVGAVGHRFGPRRMLLVGMATSVAMATVFGALPAFGGFIAAMAVNGFAQATGWSNNLGVMARWFHKRERGRVMGWWSTNFQVGGVVASALAAFALAHWGLRWGFWAGACGLAVIIVFFWFNQADQPSDRGLAAIDDSDDPASATHGDPADVRWDTLTWIQVMCVGMSYFGMKFIRYALWSWAPYVLEKNFSLKGDDAGYVSTTFDVCGIAGVIATGYLSDRLFGGRRAGLSLIMLVALVASTLMLFTVGAQSATAFAICIGVVGFTLYGPDALLSGAAAIDIGKGKGSVRAAAIICGLGSAGSVVQDLLIGKSYQSSGGEIGPILAMLVGSAVMSTACVVALMVASRGSGRAV